MAIMYEFGDALAARKDGYTELLTTRTGTPEGVRLQYEDMDVALVPGPVLMRDPELFEFAVLMRLEDMEGLEEFTQELCNMTEEESEELRKYVRESGAFKDLED